jgi:hypothetical protein
LSEAYHGRTVDQYPKIIAPAVCRHDVEERAHGRVAYRQADNSLAIGELDFYSVGTFGALVSRLNCAPLGMSGVASQALYKEQGFEIGELDLGGPLARDPDVKVGPSGIDVEADPLHHSTVQVVGNDLIGHSTLSRVLRQG